MACCCPHSHSASRFFSFFAKNYRKRFEKKGFEPSQQQLVTGIKQAGIKDATLLEVGSGVGYLHQTLLEQGACSAVGIDLSPDMLTEAKDWAKEKGLDERVHYIAGDVIAHNDEIEPADITILDKVVCCYPDAEGMVNTTITKTNRVYALTYPRNLWFIRLATEVTAFILKIFRSDFRPYIHSPEDIENWIKEAGFEKNFQSNTFIWQSQVYTKSI